METVNNDDGTLNGVTVMVRTGADDQWNQESAVGWPVVGNQFVVNVDNVSELTFTEEALVNILEALRAHNAGS